MAFRLWRTDSKRGGGPASPPKRAWLHWIAHSASLIYVVGGLFLIYQYWAGLHRQIILVTGVLFLIYGVFRYLLVRREGRRG